MSRYKPHPILFFPIKHNQVIASRVSTTSRTVSPISPCLRMAQFGILFAGRYALCLPWDGLVEVTVFLHVIASHLDLVSAPLAAFPVRGARLGERLVAPDTRTLGGVRLFFTAVSTDHAVCKGIVMILFLIMANIARERLTATWEPEPSKALLVVLAYPVIRQWQAVLDSGIFGHTLRLRINKVCCVISFLPRWL